MDLQPPPHVVDYWFDRLGLSSPLDPTPSGNHLNPTGFLPQFPPPNGNDYVSSFLGIIYCMIPFRPVHNLG